MGGLQEDVLKTLARLDSTNISNLLRDLGEPTLLFAVIRWVKDGDSLGPRAEAVAEFLLRTYNFDLSVRDATGANVLDLAAGRGLTKVISLILEKREDLLNSRDDLGRTPLSWAPKESVHSAQVLLSYKNIRSGLLDYEGLTPIDYLLKNMRSSKFTANLDRFPDVLSLMIQSSWNGLNRLDRRGYSVLHALIDQGCAFKASNWPFNVTSGKSNGSMKAPSFLNTKRLEVAQSQERVTLKAY